MKVFGPLEELKRKGDKLCLGVEMGGNLYTFWTIPSKQITPSLSLNSRYITYPAISIHFIGAFHHWTSIVICWKWTENSDNNNKVPFTDFALFWFFNENTTKWVCECEWNHGGCSSSSRGNIRSVGWPTEKLSLSGIKAKQLFKVNLPNWHLLEPTYA